MSVGILPNVNSVKTNGVVKQGISVCSRIIRLTNNRIKSRKEEKATTKNGLAVVKIVSQMGCVSRYLEFFGFSKRQTSVGKPRCKKSWDRLEEYDSVRPRYVKQVSGKRKDRRLEKYKSKSPHQRSPYAMKFEDRSVGLCLGRLGVIGFS